ncbi:hypothetical protein JTE90_023566 [Oedothorax gibbosus]|uniref:Uncharacterized protein n=1 Tax=Oedothorax gibbosus TaxID=931172 RepID=A0AAV6UC20_9ARAC|nr:hypothetical protein JTE90_023566 [Oedothorax gibbosus]
MTPYSRTTARDVKEVPKMSSMKFLVFLIVLLVCAMYCEAADEVCITAPKDVAAAFRSILNILKDLLRR